MLLVSDWSEIVSRPVAVSNGPAIASKVGGSRCTGQESSDSMLGTLWDVANSRGVRLALDGNSNAKFQYFQLIAKEWQIKKSKTNAQFSLCSTILCKLVYLLAITMFTPVQCSAIMQPVLQDGLPKAGLVCTLLHTLVVHGPLYYTGLDIPNLYTEQMVSQLTMLLCNKWKRDDTMSILLQASIEAMTLEIGLYGEKTPFHNVITK